LEDIQDDNESGFKARLRLQKLHFLAQSRFNLSAKYFYSLYKHGPYSPKLTEDSYNLDLISLQEFQEEMHLNKHSYNLPAEFEQDRFISVFLDKNVEWLEIASTLIDVKDRSLEIGTDSLIEKVSELKSNYDKKYIEEVFNDLCREKLILTISEEMEKVVRKNPDLFEALAKEDITLIK
jgi:uncharacterized protein YwgA